MRLDAVYQYARELAQTRADSVYDGLVRNDAVLVSAGFPPISEWWLEQLRALYQTGRRRLVLRVGRRGGKSSTLCRVAVAEVLYGDHVIPPGDKGVFAFVSVKKSDARERLATIAEILDALGVPYERSGDSISVQVQGRQRVFRVYAANFRTAVGMTSIGIVADELARWRDDATGANPAREVLASLRPSMATMVNAHEFLSSSPFSTLDYHYECFEQGTTDQQIAAYAPSWVANPAITEQRCRELAESEEDFEREYRAVPMSASESSLFDARELDRATRGLVTPEPGDTLTAGADFGFRRDSSALVVCARRADVYQVADMLTLRPTKEHALRPSDTVARFAEVLRAHRVPGVMCDRHYRESIVEHLAAEGLGFIDAPTDVPSTYVRFRTLLHQGRVVLPDDQALLRDLKEVTATPTATGRLSIKLPRRDAGGHADAVSALILACWQREGYQIPLPARSLSREEQAELEELQRIERQVKGDDDDGWISDSDSLFG